MSQSTGATLWFLCGALFGFSVLAIASVGLFTLPVAVLFAVLLATRGVPGGWMALTGAGLLVAGLWMLHITSGDTPDGQLTPIVLGALTAALGLMMFTLSGRSSSIERSAPTSRPNNVDTAANEHSRRWNRHY